MNRKDELLRVLAQDFLPNEDLEKLCQRWGIHAAMDKHVPHGKSPYFTTNWLATIQRLAQHALKEAE